MTSTPPIWMEIMGVSNKYSSIFSFVDFFSTNSGSTLVFQQNPTNHRPFWRSEGNTTHKVHNAVSLRWIMGDCMTQMFEILEGGILWGWETLFIPQNILDLLLYYINTSLYFISIHQ
jgi:hypothetical protein